MVKKVAIVSLSYGIMGEDSARHEVEIGIKRLQSLHNSLEMSNFTIAKQ